MNNIVDTSRQEGLEAGLVQGRAEGLSQVAQQMKQSGVPTQDIVKFTGLTADEIDNL